METADIVSDNPRPIADELTPEELAENKRYSQLELICGLADTFIDLAFLSIMALLIAPHIRGAMYGVFPNATLRLLMYLLLTTALHVIVSFPLSYYAGHILQHQFHLSRMSLPAWLRRYMLQLAISTVFMAMMFGGLYWVIWIFGAWWWAIGAIAFFLFTILVGQIAPVLILPLFYTIQRLEMPELTERIRRLAEGTGLSIEGVYRMDVSVETKKANAMLAGLGRSRRVLLTDTTLENFSPDELEVILAHEVGHHVFGHTFKAILMGALYSAGAFFICDRIVMAWARHYEPAVDYATFPVFTLPLFLLVLRTLMLGVEPLTNALSRHFERQCDRYALSQTGLKAAYVSAFRKLARLNKDDPDPPRLEVVLFHSHPPIADRLAMAERF